MSRPMIGMDSTAEALARSLAGNARNSMACPTGTSMPPPTPCRIRAPMSIHISVASPHSTDARVNSTMASSKVRLLPNRSAIQPEEGTNTARLIM